MYRSDAHAAPAAAPAPPPDGTAIRADIEAPLPRRGEPAGERPRDGSRPERSRPGWIGTGIGILAMPLTLTMMAMIVPAVWLTASRPRH